MCQNDFSLRKSLWSFNERQHSLHSTVTEYAMPQSKFWRRIGLCSADKLLEQEFSG